MLTALELKDFAIVDELRLDLAPGLNALTGETGAGKSILVDALALLVGQRADSTMIRAGCSAALIQGLFEGVSIDSAARRLQAGGRSSARIDGELVNVGELAERVGALVAVHGQHAAQALSQAEEPRRRLDRLLGEADSLELERYRESYAEYRRSVKALTESSAGARERERRRDTLRFEIEEIGDARLSTGEDTRLRQRSESLRHGERIVQGAARALSSLSEGERAAVPLLASAARDLAAAAAHQPSLAPLARELSDAAAGVQATGDEIESFLAEFDIDPAELDRVEERLVRIQSLERKYGDGVDAILAYRDDAAAELEGLEGADHDAAMLQRQVETVRGELERLGARLSAARRTAATRLSNEVSGLLARLGMPGARFEVRLEALEEAGAHGFERVRFAFGANPGEPVGELSAVGSGGELSRVMLALDVVTGSDRPVLVFDEVDAGVGGQTARAVGSLLKRLSRQHQVLVVTHLPQVAAFADAQYFVEKQSKEGRTVTRLHRLEPHEREQELARMLSGSVTDASLRNARELVAKSEASLGE